MIKRNTIKIILKMQFVIFVQLLLILSFFGNSTMTVQGVLPDNLVIKMDISHGEVEVSAENFKSNLTAAGSSFAYINTWANGSDTNVLLFPAPQSAFRATELTECLLRSFTLFIRGIDRIKILNPESNTNTVLVY